MSENLLQSELLDLIKLMPDAQVDEILTFVATLREARRLSRGNVAASPPPAAPSEAFQRLADVVQAYDATLSAGFPERGLRVELLLDAARAVIKEAASPPPAEARGPVRRECCAISQNEYLHVWAAGRCACGALPAFHDHTISNVPVSTAPPGGDQ